MQHPSLAAFMDIKHHFTVYMKWPYKIIKMFIMYHKIKLLSQRYITPSVL